MPKTKVAKPETDSTPKKGVRRAAITAKPRVEPPPGPANGTAADKQGFIEQMNSHRQKLRAAMLKEDPTLEPIFAAIDKHISELKAKQQSSGQ